ncbi:MAG: T9SS type A sorting domain-containing protein [Sporocytophaga sp.]|nr:T9SS type A sorting domain-containing protein [Sporocytophaga sp.]
MKLKLQLSGLLFISIIFGALAQEYTIEGPRTIFELYAGKTGAGRSKFTFFNFDTGREVAATDSNTANWHIAFNKTTIILNGHESGKVKGQVLNGTSFLSQTSAPESGYIVDSASGPSSKAINGINSGNNNGYWNYDGNGANGTHSITPLPGKLVAIQLGDGRYVKLEILNYYKGVPQNIPVDLTVTSPSGYFTGIGSYYTFRYLVAPEGTNDWSQLVTQVTNLEAPQGVAKYFNIASGNVLTEQEYALNATWNLIFKNPSGLGTYDNYNVGIYPNGGTFGSATDSLQLLSSDFASVAIGPFKGWQVSTAPVWYAYNMLNHTINPKTNQTILVKNSLGRYAKVRIDSYYKGGDNTDANNYGFYTLSYFFQPYATDNLNAEPGIATSVVSSHATEKLSVFPNPLAANGGMLNVKSNSENSTIKISDITGKLVYQDSFSSETTISGLSKGMYIVSVESEGSVKQEKLIVE